LRANGHLIPIDSLSSHRSTFEIQPITPCILLLSQLLPQLDFVPSATPDQSRPSSLLPLHCLFFLFIISIRNEEFRGYLAIFLELLNQIVGDLKR
jgi:hypothetical protein